MDCRHKSGNGEMKKRVLAARARPRFILPHASGGGVPRPRAVEAASDSTILLRRQRSCASEAPSTMLRMVPLPRFRGADNRNSFSRRDARPRFANNEANSQSPRKKEGIRAPRGASNQCPRHTGRRCRLPMRGARKRAKSRGALAFRRSTAALAEALTPWLSSGPRFLELPGANGRTLPGASAASTSRTGRSAGRDDARSRPSAGLRAPPAGTALAPPSVRHR